jgi:hypothetical protein
MTDMITDRTVMTKPIHPTMFGTTLTQLKTMSIAPIHQEAQMIRLMFMIVPDNIE